MAWHIPLALGGPVLHWELVRGARQHWLRFLWYGYAAWLSVQGITLYSSYRSATAVLLSEEERRHLLDFPDYARQGEMDRLLSQEEQLRFREMDQMSATGLERARYEARARFCRDYLFLVLQQQLLLLLLLTPLVTAGALGHEKERGTLAALFGTEMSAWQIIIGKLLGRLTRLISSTLVVLPAIIMLSVLADIEARLLLLAFAQACVLTFAVASICMRLSGRAERATPSWPVTPSLHSSSWHP